MEPQDVWTYSKQHHSLDFSEQQPVDSTMDSNTTSQTNNQENLDNSNVGETEEEVEVEDQHVPGFSSQQLCEAVFRTLEIHGKPQALKGRPAETEEK